MGVMARKQRLREVRGLTHICTAKLGFKFRNFWPLGHLTSVWKTIKEGLEMGELFYSV
jgi:hypothetical protein